MEQGGDQARFLQNGNNDAKYYGNKGKAQKKNKVTYLQFSEYFSVLPDTADSGMMDGKYCIYTEIMQIYLFQFCLSMILSS